jgi:hypothetical protein
MTTAIWQNKSLIKTGKKWQKPDHIKNRPKGMSLEEWQNEVAEWKLNKLIVLDKVPKASKKEFVSKDKDDE